MDFIIGEINKHNATQFAHNIDQAVELYIRIFAEAPYFESFEFQAVKDSFNNFIDMGLFIIAMINGLTIGFICTTHGIDHKISDELTVQAARNGLQLNSDIYISELGVAPEYRNLKIGKKLVEHVLHIYYYKTTFLRTNLYDNDFVINFYKRLGFEQTTIIETVQQTRNNGEVKEDERVYMMKKKEEIDDVRNAEEYYGLDNYHESIDVVEENDACSGGEEMYDLDKNESDYDDDGYRSGAEEYYE